MKDISLNTWIDESLPKFELLGKHVAFIVENLLQQNGIDYLSVSYRTKTKEGVIEKIGRKNYKNPIEELTDISGVRVILYLESDIGKVSDVIKSTFNIDFKNSVDNEGRLSSDKVGYRSVHYVCDIGEKRNALKEYEYISGLTCEIQVRTMLQHAWAELTHDRNYKLGTNLPLQIQRKINLFSGMLEIADEGFSEIVNSIEEYKESIRNNDLEQLFSQEINSINLFKFVQEITKDIGLNLEPVKDWGGSTTKDVIDELKYSELDDFKLIADAIPDNYVEVCNEYFPENNIYGFLRDIMLIKNFDGLSRKEPLNWALVGDEDGEEADKAREYYSHFMPEDEAMRLVRTFAVND
ncbi:GTP pyrophosphokinase [Erwinia sp. PsM31]|uniref:GTP pyrophosphokinase n=1 Tax=Erwinia sp. PsM31 TaxID=3030535 RepID=UPI00263A85F7|nr:RelA/SpoT domain-containing protein [Erwinia sp. PsM31]MDN4628644.1 RelA/SpoT domain-containing protein [Erwinia sp. PsM31]